MSAHPGDTLESNGPAPARVAVLSDVHANLPAFEAVLDDIRSVGVDEVWNLGDLVGYGAQPDECVALARESCDLSLIGNHDLVVIGDLDLNEFSAGAARAAAWTSERVSAETKDFLTTLEKMDESKPIGLYHASPRDPVWEYVLSTTMADLCFDAMQPRAGAVGHSHVALYFRRGDDDGSATGAQAPHGTELDLSNGRWLVNPGGVGQPRDGDPRAAWLLLDLGAWTATWRRVEYPIDAAARAIEDAGLPQELADRLYFGR